MLLIVTISVFFFFHSEAYRTALQAFLERRKDPDDPGYIVCPNSPDKERLDFISKNNYVNNKNENKNNYNDVKISNVPQAHASDIFEIGWVAGTEDRYMELIYAEWQNTKVALRRHDHPDCKNAVKADLEVLE